MQIQAVIDRIEEGIAVLELDIKTQIEIPIKFLPAGVKERQVLILSIEKSEKK